MVPVTAALIVPTRALWEQATGCIRNLPVRIALDQPDPEDWDALLDRLARHRVDVVLVEFGKIPMGLEEFVRRLRQMPSQPAVFVLNTEAEPGQILETLRSGASEYLHPPLSDPLQKAFENLSAARSRTGSAGSGSMGRIFGFISARGGCGATTIVIHTANVLSRQITPLLLADFDFEAGLLRFLMKSKNTYSLRDALDNMHRMDVSYWKALVSRHQNGMEFIAAPDEVAARLMPENVELPHLMRFIRSMYPVSLIDFGRAVSLPALDSLSEIDTLYLVTALEINTLDQTRRAIGQIEATGFDSQRLKVLVNRVPPKGVPDPQAVEGYIGRPWDARFTNDFMSLYDAFSEGHLVDSSAVLGKEIGAFAASIQARVKGEAAERRVETVRPAAQPKRWFPFFQRAQA